MNIEHESSPDYEFKAPIELTQGEYNVLSEASFNKDGQPEDQKVAELLKAKGIKPDSGEVDIIINSHKSKMQTNVDDFGTSTYR